MEFDWINLLQVLGGIIVGGGGAFGIKAAIAKGKAEVERLHMQIDHQQKSLDKYLDIEKENAARIAELNGAISDKTEQIRRLTEQTIASEHGRNADKDEIARLTKKNGDLRVELEYHKMWRCERPDCKDPRGRRPPNDKLAGLTYNPPKSGN